MNDELNTTAISEWCPGCGNFSILNDIKSVLLELESEGLDLKDVVIVSGIGQHAKMVDYLNINSLYSLHGRGVAAATGIKIANPKLKVIVFVGDGDSYGEGLEHLLFAAKRNIDITVIVHNNRVYALTTGQYTPTSPLGFKGRSTPHGTAEKPYNPLELLLAAGANHLLRGYTGKPELLKAQMKEAILHKGFSLIDTLQVCITFYNMYDKYNKNVYELKNNDPASFDDACKHVREWDYDTDAPISLGTFYKKDAQTYEASFNTKEKKLEERTFTIKTLLDRYI